MSKSTLTKISRNLYELKDSEGNWWTVTRSGLKGKSGYEWHADTSTVGKPMVWGRSTSHVVEQIENL